MYVLPLNCCYLLSSHPTRFYLSLSSHLCVSCLTPFSEFISISPVFLLLPALCCWSRTLLLLLGKCLVMSASCCYCFSFSYHWAIIVGKNISTGVIVLQENYSNAEWLGEMPDLCERAQNVNILKCRDAGMIFNLKKRKMFLREYDMKFVETQCKALKLVPMVRLWGEGKVGRETMKAGRFEHSCVAERGFVKAHYASTKRS